MEETISLQDLYKIIRKRLAMIISITAVAVIISAIISFFVLTPIYQASTQILVNQQQKTNNQQLMFRIARNSN